MSSFVSDLSAELRAQYPFKTELHAHTNPASDCSEISPEEAVRLYRGLGYSAICITNHMDTGLYCTLEEWTEDYYRAKAEGEKLGLDVIFGVEVRLDNDGNHYQLIGITPEEIPEVFKTLNLPIAEFSRLWRGEGRLFNYAHPHRGKNTLADYSLFDSIEAFNVHPDSNSRVAVTSREGREFGIPLTAGTDFHHPTHEGLSALRSRFAPKTGGDIASILRSGDYVLEIGGSIVIP
ncbi:MAG: PHP domain-containing protein [Clostridia bacterium]|nr:PHP domain-containing protein [Clostridia bacterium]